MSASDAGVVTLSISLDFTAEVNAAFQMAGIDLWWEQSIAVPTRLDRELAQTSEK